MLQRFQSFPAARARPSFPQAQPACHILAGSMTDCVTLGPARDKGKPWVGNAPPDLFLQHSCGELTARGDNSGNHIKFSRSHGRAVPLGVSPPHDTLNLRCCRRMAHGDLEGPRTDASCLYPASGPWIFVRRRAAAPAPNSSIQTQCSCKPRARSSSFFPVRVHSRDRIADPDSPN